MMSPVESLITEHLDLWTTTVKRKSSAGRGGGKKTELYGIKKLRELILELAVRGLLVPQDPNDEPADVLLERIAAEKARLVKEGKIKKQKALPPVAEEEKPFELPAGWEAIRLNSLLPQFQNGASSRGDKNGKNIVVVRLADISNWKVNLTHPRTLLINETSIERYSLAKGDVLIIRVNGSADIVGRFIFCERDFDAIYCDHFIRMRFPVEVFLPQYLSLMGASSIVRKHIEDMFISTAGQKTVNQKHIGSLVLTVSPLSEQHRIVTKANELMALCDQLEQKTEANISAHQTLVETLLSAITSTNSAEAIPLLFANFDNLFTTEHSIDQLKQTILQLAVMGKLVPQDPNDEPASVLLEKIAAEKAQLIKEKKIKKQKALPPIGEEEKPFELPVGWEWAYVGDVIELKHGYAFKSTHFVNEPTPYVLTTPGNFYETGGFRDRGPKTRFYDGDVDPEFTLQAGDLIIPMTEQAAGLLGSAAFIPNDGKKYIHNQRLGKLSPYNECITSNFVALYFNAPYLRNQLSESCSGTTVRHTSPSKVFSVLFPVCSPNEQRRIVAKVDELMTLCDQLKTQLTNSQTIQLKLTDTMTRQTVN